MGGDTTEVSQASNTCRSRGWVVSSSDVTTKVATPVTVRVLLSGRQGGVETVRRENGVPKDRFSKRRGAVKMVCRESGAPIVRFSEWQGAVETVRRESGAPKDHFSERQTKESNATQAPAVTQLPAGDESTRESSTFCSTEKVAPRTRRGVTKSRVNIRNMLMWMLAVTVTGCEECPCAQAPKWLTEKFNTLGDFRRAVVKFGKSGDEAKGFVSSQPATRNLVNLP